MSFLAKTDVIFEKQQIGISCVKYAHLGGHLLILEDPTII